jgi:hypothetical protein
VGEDQSQDKDHSGASAGDGSTESLLEALLVDDAEIVWDPVTGEPRVSRRPKIGLDSPPGSA